MGGDYMFGDIIPGFAERECVYNEKVSLYPSGDLNQMG